MSKRERETDDVASRIRGWTPDNTASSSAFGSGISEVTRDVAGRQWIKLNSIARRDFAAYIMVDYLECLHMRLTIGGCEYHLLEAAVDHFTRLGLISAVRHVHMENLGRCHRCPPSWIQIELQDDTPRLLLLPDRPNILTRLTHVHATSHVATTFEVPWKVEADRPFCRFRARIPSQTDDDDNMYT